MDIVAKRILELRMRHDLNKTEFAEKLGINRSTITRYESGEIKPNLEIMLRMNDVFGVSLDWIAGLDETPIRYAEAVRECIDYNITPNKLHQAIDLLKGD